MSYKDTLLALADRGEAQADELWQRHRDGELTDTEVVELLAVAVTVANRRATSLADLGLAAAVSVSLGRPVAPLGIAPTDDLPRLRKSAATVVELGTDRRAARLARSEVLATAAQTFSTAMRVSPHVIGWRRQLGAQPCVMCQGWASSGVMPDTAPMATHKGCSCTAVPVTTKEEQP